MKKIFFLLFAIFFGFNALSQSLPQVVGVKLTTKKDYRAADTIADKVADYILKTPSDQKSTPRLNGISFLLHWMRGTPDYTFDIDQNVVKYFEDDTDLMGVYMAALTASGLQNKNVNDPKALTSLAVKKFIDYINNNSNGVKLNGDLKKLIEAQQQGDF